MNRVLTLASFNVSQIVAERAGLVLSWALFALQFGIFGSLMSHLVQSSKVQDYFFFYGVGLMVITVFDTGSFVGRRFVERAHEGELPYYLSLPISRRGFLESQAVYGIVATLLRAGPPLIGVLAAVVVTAIAVGALSLSAGIVDKIIEGVKAA